MNLKEFWEDFNIKNQLLLNGRAIFSFIMAVLAGFLAEIIFGDYAWWFFLLQTIILLIMMALCVVIIQISTKFNEHYYALKKNFAEAKKNIYCNEPTRLFGENSKKIIKFIIPSVFCFLVIAFCVIFFIYKSDDDKINIPLEFNRIKQQDSITIKQLESIEQKNDIMRQQINELFDTLKLQNQQQDSVSGVIINMIDSIKKNRECQKILYPDNKNIHSSTKQ